jgi:hypothetical protein
MRRSFFSQKGFIGSGLLSILFVCGASAYLGNSLYKDRVAFNQLVTSNSSELLATTTHPLGGYRQANGRALFFNSGSVILEDYNPFLPEKQLTLKNIKDEAIFPWPDSKAGLNLCSEKLCMKVIKTSLKT